MMVSKFTASNGV